MRGRRCWTPAIRRSQRFSIRSCDDRVGFRDLKRAPLRVSRVLVATPPPPLDVRMGLGRPLELPPGEVHEGRDLVAEFLILGLEGPIREDLPEDLVGLGSPTHPSGRGA